MPYPLGSRRPRRPGTIRAAGCVVLAGAFAAATACQSFTPITAGAPPAGEEVRVVLADAAAQRLAPTIGAGVGAIDGRVAAAGGDSLRVAVEATVLRTGERAEWKGEPVTLARGDVASLQQRRVSAGRTAALGAAVAAAALILARAVGSGSGSGFVGGGTGTGK